MPTIYLSQEVDYVTMINYFSVAPEDQQEFAEIEVQEIEQYGDQMNAAIAASFHRSLVGSRVFNYAHWQSKEALEASQQTEEFKAHIKRMSHLNFTPNPRVYQVVEIFSPEPIVIDSNNNLITVLTMIETQANLQKQIIEKLNLTLPALKRRGFLVHRSNFPMQDCSNIKSGSNSPSFKDPVCPTVLRAFFKMFLAALMSLSSTYLQ